MAQDRMSVLARRLAPLARPIDPRYPSNLYILVVGAVVLVATAVLEQSDSLEDTLVFAITAAIATMLAWALGREIDPDHPLSANIAAPLTAVGIWIWDKPQILGLVALLLAMRAINRTVGLPAGPGELVAMLLLAGLTDHALFVLIIAVALISEIWLPRPKRPLYLITAGWALVLAIVIGFSFPDDWKLDPMAAIIATIIAGSFVAMTLRAPREFESLTDHTEEPVAGERILAGQLLLAGAVIAFMAWEGNDGLLKLLPVWTAMAGYLLARGLYQTTYRSS